MHLPFVSTALAAALVGLLLASTCAAQAQSPPTQTASYSVETVLSLTSDRRTRGVSDSLRGPSAELMFTLAHESGLIGLLQIDTVSKRLFPEGRGIGITAAGGYRWGDPEGLHFGVGLAREFFPGAKLPVAPTTFDPATGEFGGFEQGSFNSNYAVLEAGWNLLELRYLRVFSKDYRGANTASVCGTQVMQPDPSNGIACYLNGVHHSRGTQLLDVDLKLPLDGQTKLLLHWGLQRVANFKQANTQDWRLGVQHTRWGCDFSAEYVGAKTRARELFVGVRSDGSSRQLDSGALVLTVAKKF